MSGVLQNKVAIVTGGGAGMGRAVAERFAREGAEVVVSEIDPKRGQATVESICATGGRALFIQTDVGEESAVANLADTVKTSYGQVDILYNNAAVLYHNLEARAHELSSAIWEHTLRVNLRGLWLCSKYVIPLMLRAGGSIIHVGSPTALNGSGAGMTAYCVRQPSGELHHSRSHGHPNERLISCRCGQQEQYGTSHPPRSRRHLRRRLRARGFSSLVGVCILHRRHLHGGWRLHRVLRDSRRRPDSTVFL
jgi:hypothetical protein